MDPSAPLSSTPPAAATFDPATLLAQAAWIRRLARALVQGGDPALDADDVEQQTWLFALRKPGVGTDPRGWLREIARNVARRFARDHALRQRREEIAAARESTDAHDDSIARVELHGRVVQAVVALPEPYRSTLIDRFLDEQTPTRIAGRRGVPVETVKTRLKRGLALLRERFEAEERARSAGRGDWRAVLLPLLGESGLRAGGAIGATLMMNLKTKLAGVALAAAVVIGASICTVLVSASAASSRGPVAPDEPRAATSPPARDLVPIVTEEVAREAPGSEPVDLEPVAAAIPRFPITGQVLDLAGNPVADALVCFDDGEPSHASDALGWLATIAAARDPSRLLRATTFPVTRSDAEGRFEFSVSRALNGAVAGWHPHVGIGRSDSRHVRGNPSPYVLRLWKHASIKGRVVDEDGAPVPHFELELESRLAGETPKVLSPLPIKTSKFWAPLPWTRNGEATFEIGPIPAAECVVTATALGCLATTTTVDATSRERLEVELVLQRDRDAVFSGRIVLDGQLAAPLPDALLPDRRPWEVAFAPAVISSSAAIRLVRFEDSTHPTASGRPLRLGAALPASGWNPAGTVDLATATYRVPKTRKFDPRRGHYGLVVRDVVVAVAQAHGADALPDLVVDPAILPARPARGTIRIKLVGDAHADYDDRAIRFRLATPGPTSEKWFTVRPDGGAGEFVVEHVPPARVIVRASLPSGLETAGEVIVAPDRESTLTLPWRVGAARVLGFVEGARGVEIKKLGSVAIHAREGGRTLLPALDSMEPTGQFFCFDGLMPGEYALTWIRATGTVTAVVTASEDPAPVRLRGGDGLEASLSVRFGDGERPESMYLRVLAADGTPLFVEDRRGSGAPWEKTADPTFRLPGGRHRLQLFAEGAEPVELEIDPQRQPRLDVVLERR